jgi:hypothetical protein
MCILRQGTKKWEMKKTKAVDRPWIRHVCFGIEASLNGEAPIFERRSAGELMGTSDVVLYSKTPPPTHQFSLPAQPDQGLFLRLS